MDKNFSLNLPLSHNPTLTYTKRRINSFFPVTLVTADTEIFLSLNEIILTFRSRLIPFLVFNTDPRFLLLRRILDVFFLQNHVLSPKTAVIEELFCSSENYLKIKKDEINIFMTKQ